VIRVNTQVNPLKRKRVDAPLWNASAQQSWTRAPRFDIKVARDVLARACLPRGAPVCFLKS
jgi:hypothetical protein